MVFTPAFINLFLAERGIIIISVVLLLFLFVLKIWKLDHERRRRINPRPVSLRTKVHNDFVSWTDAPALRWHFYDRVRGKVGEIYAERAPLLQPILWDFRNALFVELSSATFTLSGKSYPKRGRLLAGEKRCKLHSTNVT